MKTFRVVLLITGILVAGLAFNTSFAQDAPVRKYEYGSESTFHDKEKPKVKIKAHNKMHKAQHKHAIKSHSKENKLKPTKTHKVEKNRNTR